MIVFHNLIFKRLRVTAKRDYQLRHVRLSVRMELLGSQ